MQPVQPSLIPDPHPGASGAAGGPPAGGGGRGRDHAAGRRDRQTAAPEGIEVDAADE